MGPLLKNDRVWLTFNLISWLSQGGQSQELVALNGDAVVIKMRPGSGSTQGGTGRDEMRSLVDGVLKARPKAFANGLDVRGRTRGLRLGF